MLPLLIFLKVVIVGLLSCLTSGVILLILRMLADHRQLLVAVLASIHLVHHLPTTISLTNIYVRILVIFDLYRTSILVKHMVARRSLIVIIHTRHLGLVMKMSL